MASKLGLGVYLKAICIFKKGQVNPQFVKVFVVQFNSAYIFRMFFVVQDIPQSIYRHAIAAVVYVVAVVTYAVKAYGVALVLYSAGYKQVFPRLYAALGPVGYI
jgi:hypothetical protein